jgi:hypothetical protein
MTRYEQMVNRFLGTTKDTSRHVEVMRIVAYWYLVYQLVGGTYSSIYICTTTFITVYFYNNILHLTIVPLSCPMSRQLRVQWPFSWDGWSSLQFNGRLHHKIPLLNFHHSLAISFSIKSWLCMSDTRRNPLINGNSHWQTRPTPTSMLDVYNVLKAWRYSPSNLYMQMSEWGTVIPGSRVHN